MKKRLHTPTLAALLALLLLLSATTKAHTMWIDTPFEGQTGRQQTVRIFFGEFSLRMISPADRWFSDIADCRLTLLAPDGTRTVLQKTPADSCYTASFTPTTDGWYLLFFEHTVRDLYEGMRITYQAQSWVRVGHPDGPPTTASPFSHGRLFLPPSTPFRLDTPAIVTLTEAGKLATSRRITLTTDNGWRKNLRSDAKTAIASTPLLFPADYLFEWTDNPPVNDPARRISPDHQSDYITLNYFFRP